MMGFARSFKRTESLLRFSGFPACFTRLTSKWFCLCFLLIHSLMHHSFCLMFRFSFFFYKKIRIPWHVVAKYWMSSPASFSPHFRSSFSSLNYSSYNNSVSHFSSTLICSIPDIDIMYVYVQKQSWYCHVSIAHFHIIYFNNIVMACKKVV